jgi:hypothetical protein
MGFKSRSILGSTGFYCTAVHRPWQSSGLPLQGHVPITPFKPEMLHHCLNLWKTVDSTVERR